MSGRSRLLDFKLSRFPAVLGNCQGDTPTAAGWVNSATQRLLYAKESNDSGFWGGWSEMAFTVTRESPYLTAPREVARLEHINICSYPVPVNNQFYEYLRFGFGRMPKNECNNTSCLNGVAAYDRGMFPAARDLKPPNKIIRAYITDDSDENKRTLIQGKDNNGQTIYSLDNGVQVDGLFLTFASPLVDTPTEMSKLTGIQKDPTNGPVRYFEVDNVTGAQRLIAMLEPSETVACFRRYYIDNLPKGCCTVDDPTVQVTAIAKLDYIPVKTDTDYLIVGNIEALGNECLAIYYSEVQTENAKQMAQYHHREAIRLLNGELIHREGKLEPAVIFSPFGTARLTQIGFGRMK